MSIGFLVVELLVINDENRFRVFEESSQSEMQIQIMLNINTVIAGDDSEDQFRKLIDILY